jgi:hypothetical protein
MQKQTTRNDGADEVDFAGIDISVNISRVPLIARLYRGTHRCGVSVLVGASLFILIKYALKTSFDTKYLYY